MTNDTYNIVPRGVTVARVTPFDFQVRTMAEYDVTFLQDRIRSDIFVNGKPCGIYSTVVVDDDFTRYGRDGLREALETYAPGLENGLVDEFMGLGYRKKVTALEIEVLALRDFVERDRWFHFVKTRRALTEVLLRIRSAWLTLLGRTS